MESLGLDSRILDALGRLGFHEFTEPQRQAIPRILAGMSVLVIAPTGIGKTEAAILPILHRILTERGALVTVDGSQRAS
ncbi:MAG: DEAD/DEAH box helicase [Methanobacteriota archaeon]|nr:MAG: DEAD/DEAH box helicase [Euryarchaeota archaeon]